MRESSPSATISTSASWSVAASAANSSGIGPSMVFPESSVRKPFIPIRSIAPRKPFSLPMGASTQTQERPNFVWIWSITRPPSAFSRSIRLTTIIFGRPNSSATCQAFSVWTSTPATASTTMMAASAARIAQIISAVKMP